MKRIISGYFLPYVILIQFCSLVRALNSLSEVEWVGLEKHSSTRVYVLQGANYISLRKKRLKFQFNES